jgi:hypothetical protein
MKIKMRKSSKLSLKLLIPLLIAIVLLPLSLFLASVGIIPVFLVLPIVFGLIAAIIILSLMLRFYSHYVSPVVDITETYKAGKNVLKDKKTFDLNQVDSDGASYNDKSYEEIAIRSTVTQIKGTIENFREGFNHPWQLIFGGIFLLFFGGMIFLIYTEASHMTPNEPTPRLLIYVGILVITLLCFLLVSLLWPLIVLRRVNRDPEAFDYSGTVDRLLLRNQTIKPVTTSTGNFVNNRYKVMVMIAGQYETATYVKNPKFGVGDTIIIRWNPNRPKYCKFISIAPSNYRVN